MVVIARSFGDEAIQRPWVATPLIAARDDEIDNSQIIALRVDKIFFMEAWNFD